MLRFNTIYKNYSPTLRWQIIGAYMRLLVGNRFFRPRSEGKFNLGAFTVTYPNRGSLYAMFAEVFLDQNYFIEETNAPLTIVDGGTNIGLASVYFKMKAPNAKIISFEPNTHTFAILKKNMQRNNVTAELHNAALGNSTEEVTFYTDVNDIESQGSSVTKHLESKKRTLEEMKTQMVKLSDYITDEIDILKLDIEGAEGLVFEDLCETGKLQKIKKIFLEYHYDGVNTTYPLGKILTMLEEKSFSYALVSPFNFPVTKQPNVIYSYKIVAWRNT